MPVSVGSAPRSCLNASSPPAEAPTPTMGKALCGGRACASPCSSATASGEEASGSADRGFFAPGRDGRWVGRGDGAGYRGASEGDGAQAAAVHFVRFLIVCWPPPVVHSVNAVGLSSNVIFSLFVIAAGKRRNRYPRRRSLLCFEAVQVHVRFKPR